MPTGSPHRLTGRLAVVTGASAGFEPGLSPEDVSGLVVALLDDAVAAASGANLVLACNR
ncbi:MAG: hypothetical protein ACRDZ3_08765 [Acidimicrobiia bacterium]